MWYRLGTVSKYLMTARWEPVTLWHAARDQRVGIEKDLVKQSVGEPWSDLMVRIMSNQGTSTDRRVERSLP